MRKKGIKKIAIGLLCVGLLGCGVRDRLERGIALYERKDRGVQPQTPLCRNCVSAEEKSSYPILFFCKSDSFCK